MALQRMIFSSSGNVGKSFSDHTTTTTSSKILNCTDHSYNKWTNVRMHQDPFLKNEKQKREPIPI